MSFLPTLSKPLYNYSDELFLVTVPHVPVKIAAPSQPKDIQQGAPYRPETILERNGRLRETQPL